MKTMPLRYRWSLLSLMTGLLVMAAVCVPTNIAQAQEQSSGCNLSASEVEKITGQRPTFYIPDITIPGFTAGSQVEINGSTIGNYIRGIFIIFIWSVAVLAVVMVIYGGIKWVAAAGNPGQINDAKDVVTNAVIGLVIALTSFLVLRLINPDFTSFSPLSVNRISRCTLATLNFLTEEAGLISNRCSMQQVAGAPRRVCFADPNTPCLSASLNDLINANSKFNRRDGSLVDVDHVLIKALIMSEAQARDGDTVVSGPTAGRACASDSARCRLKGTAYGIIQANHVALVDHWQKVAGTVPSDCTGDESNWRDASGSLKTSCSRHLDTQDGVVLQIRIMASILAEAQERVKKSPTVLAAAYHLGEGGANSFFTNGASRDEQPAASVRYLKKFNTNYTQQCGTGPSGISDPQ